VSTYITASEPDRQHQLDEALGMKGWAVGLITIDCEGGTLVARTQAFDPDAQRRLHELAQRLLDAMDQPWRLFRFRLL